MADERRPPSVTGMAVSRKQRWLAINSEGVKTTVYADKRSMIQMFSLGIPTRDLRLLDTKLMPSVAKVAVRDRAMVFAVDFVRLIITAERVIIPQDGFGKRTEYYNFLDKLLQALIDAAQQRRRYRNLAHLQQQAQRSGELFDIEDVARSSSGVSSSGASSRQTGESLGLELPLVPFELTVLETALHEVCQHYAVSDRQLEATTTTALDALLKSVQPGTLEAVRKLKTRHQRLLRQVTTVRDELESFLKDDDDMAKMCLTRKQEQEHGVPHEGPVLERRPSLSLPLSRDLRRQFKRSGSAAGSSPPSRLLPAYSAESGSPRGGAAVLVLAHKSPGAAASAAHAVAEEEALQDAEADAMAIEEVENLLESYFIQIDRTYDRLVSLEEYMKDTEAYIDIELDSSQNRLFRLDIVLTAATFALALYHVVAGILGENLVIPPVLQTEDAKGFAAINFTTLGVSLIVFAAIHAYLKHKRLLNT